jgi:hypothetical protein
MSTELLAVEALGGKLLMLLLAFRIGAACAPGGKEPDTSFTG